MQRSWLEMLLAGFAGIAIGLWVATILFLGPPWTWRGSATDSSARTGVPMPEQTAERSTTSLHVHSPSGHGVPQGQATGVNREQPGPAMALKREFQKPQTYDLKTISQQLQPDCTKNPACLNNALLTITETYGPTASLETLRMLHQNGLINIAADDHHIAHEIGKKTAEHFGLNGQAFLLCPTSFHYGCQHGFFQYALEKAGGMTVEAAVMICGSLDNLYAQKFQFSCYHGLGHGVMMTQEYDLTKALATCDTFASPMGPEACWQGVFMENVNAGMRGDRRATTFSKVDPLAPCDSVQEKYRHQCFMNHSGWLMMLFNKDIGKASSACLQAPTPYITSCLQSIALMVTNRAWQPLLSTNSDKQKFEETAWELCNKFPETHRDQCVIGGIDNMVNFDDSDVVGARDFCNTVDGAYKSLCYYRIGISLRRQATDLNVVREKCATFTGNEAECLRGANL